MTSHRRMPAKSATAASSLTPQVIDLVTAKLPGFDISQKGQAGYATRARSILKFSARDNAIGVGGGKVFHPIHQNSKQISIIRLFQVHRWLQALAAQTPPCLPRVNVSSGQKFGSRASELAGQKCRLARNALISQGF